LWALLWSEGQVAFAYKADRAAGIERVGIENLLILFATRAAGRLIKDFAMTLIACALAPDPSGPVSPSAGGSLCPHDQEKGR